MKIAYDCTLKQPGCPLLQAALGGNPELAHWFEADDWLVHPTADLKVYEVTETQMRQLASLTENRGKA